MADPRVNADLIQRVEAVHQELLSFIDDEGRLALVKAPPGSGKTFLLLRAAIHASRLGLRVAVATQTNSQADDICRRLSASAPEVPGVRFAAAHAEPCDLGSSIEWITATKALPSGPGIAVGNSAKWGLVKALAPFDILFVEEAWQLSWADFMLLEQVAGRFVLVGDPGQVPPVVTVDTARWETSARPPHRSAPEVILARAPDDLLSLELPATWRLPHDTVELVREFYDFDFEAVVAPGERRLVRGTAPRGRLQRALTRLTRGSVLWLSLPTAERGASGEHDDELARLAAAVVTELLAMGARYKMGGQILPLEPADVGLCATHRAMVSAMGLALSSELAPTVRVDTPERWQGLECKVMVIIHPLSGVERPTSFDLETGRLCVMTSRHQVALVILSRDHVGTTLSSLISSAEQAVGTPDTTGRGRDQHLRLWQRLSDNKRIVALSPPVCAAT